jgi:hypothetical protein
MFSPDMTAEEAQELQAHLEAAAAILFKHTPEQSNCRILRVLSTLFATIK